jgi:hypothetical protein
MADALAERVGQIVELPAMVSPPELTSDIAEKGSS